MEQRSFESVEAAPGKTLDPDASDLVVFSSPGWWDEPLSDGAEEVRTELVNVLDDIGAKLARKL